ncbi:MAG: hypothetical protein HZB99_01075 [Candidatus Harrisonbacteria bacterium]|nr:hypothetical protein [Candidatus Harrisonbacteria bacterium]
MNEMTGSKIVENLSQEWTDLETLSFLHSCPQMLKESFCFRTLMGYNSQAIGGDQVCILYVEDNPKRSLLVSLAKSDSSKSFLSSEPIIPTIFYHLSIAAFDFRATFLGLQYAIREEQRKIREQSKRIVSDQDALAILFRKGAGLLGEKKLLEASYKKKCYWGWIRRLLSCFQEYNQDTWRQEQIFMLLNRMYEALNERMYNPSLNGMENLKFFAG